MKYIDADKLITIIKERKAQQDLWINRYHDPINQGIPQELTEILSLINSLQQEQPEVDLEREADQWRHEHFAGKRDGHYSGEYLERSSQLDIARHFYELGLNAGKEE